MADDNGLIADIENAMVTAIDAVTLSGDSVFRTVQNWRGQLEGPGDFLRFAPFAFVEYNGTPSYSDEGGDLQQQMQFTVRIGTEIAKKNAGARLGIGTDASKKQLGISRLRDLVITALQKVVLSTTSADVDYCEYLGDQIVYKEPKGRRYAILMTFRINRVASY